MHINIRETTTKYFSKNVPSSGNKVTASYRWWNNIEKVVKYYFTICCWF